MLLHPSLPNFWQDLIALQFSLWLSYENISASLHYLDPSRQVRYGFGCFLSAPDTGLCKHARYPIDRLIYSCSNIVFHHLVKFLPVQQVHGEVGTRV